jgi:hypothetical protein
MHFVIFIENIYTTYCRHSPKMRIYGIVYLYYSVILFLVCRNVFIFHIFIHNCMLIIVRFYEKNYLLKEPFSLLSPFHFRLK